MTNSVTPELLVVEGPAKGQRFTVTGAGLRMGRSSTCEIAIKDPELSRSHCLFEVHNGSLHVTDLASANGTEVNGEAISDKDLKPGDIIAAGVSKITVVAPSTVDLGFSKSETGAEAAGSSDTKRSPFGRIIIAVAAAVAVAAIAMILLAPKDKEPAIKQVSSEKSTQILSLSYEKVEADTNGIFRYSMTIDNNRLLRVIIDDIPAENRHVNKSKTLPEVALERLAKTIDSSALASLEHEYTGVPAHANSLKSFNLKIIRESKVQDISVENAAEPEAFREVREALEAFSKNELGIWAIQYSSDKLAAMSDEARKFGNAKWDERDVQYGNIAAAIKAYKEASFYLETLNPKPNFYDTLTTSLREAEEELDRRYRDQRFRADRAINMGDWEIARQELRILCDLVPDDSDARHSEASAKLLDVESRMKKGTRR